MGIVIYGYTFDLLWTALYIADVIAVALIVEHILWRRLKGRSQPGTRSSNEEGGVKMEQAPVLLRDTVSTRGGEKSGGGARGAEQQQTPSFLGSEKAGLPQTTFKVAAGGTEQRQNPSFLESEKAGLPQTIFQVAAGGTEQQQTPSVLELEDEGLPQTIFQVAANGEAGFQERSDGGQTQGDAPIKGGGSPMDVFAFEEDESSEAHALVKGLGNPDIHELLSELRAVANQLRGPR